MPVQSRQEERTDKAQGAVGSHAGDRPSSAEQPPARLRGAWAAQRETGVGWLGRCANSLRVAIGTFVVFLLRYLWVQLELHLRRVLPRREHYLAMRFFQLVGRTYPVVVEYRNPISRDGRRLVMSFDLCQNHAPFFLQRERYEVEWVRLVAQAMQAARCFVDVGAHGGMYALAIAQAFPDRRVMACEPYPDNFNRLVRHVRLNQLANVEAIQAAITDEPGPVWFFPNPIHDGGGSLRRFAAYRTGDVVKDAGTYHLTHPRFQNSLQVAARRLDDVVTELSVVKIDVEGAEAAVLRSGQRAFETGLIDMVIVEVIQEMVEEVARFLDAIGFDGFLLGRRLPLGPHDQLRSRLENVLALRRGSSLYDTVEFL